MRNQGPGNGEKLELSLGEEFFIHGSIETLGNLSNHIGQSGQGQGLLYILIGAGSVIKGDLIPDIAGDGGKLLLNQTEYMPFFFLRDETGILSKQGYRAPVRLIETGE